MSWLIGAFDSLFLSQITMWDLQSGKLLRTITDAHPLGSAVLHVMVRKGGDIGDITDSGTCTGT